MSCALRRVSSKGPGPRARGTLRPLLRSALVATLALALTACGRDADTWRAELEDPDPFVRSLAALGLGLEHPAAGADALPVLLETVDRAELGLQGPAREVLRRVAPAVAPQLLDELVEDEFMTAERRAAVCEALAGVGPAVAPAVVACLAGPGRERAGDLGEVLLAVGPAAAPALEPLAASHDEALATFARWLLGELARRSSPRASPGGSPP